MKYDTISTNNPKTQPIQPKEIEDKKETEKAAHTKSTKKYSRNKSKYIINHSKST